MMEQTLKRIVDYAIKTAEPEEIILFGSMAGGTPDVYSDIDLLIVTKTSFSKKDAIARIRHFSEALCLRADVLMYTKDEMNVELQTPFSFISAVAKAGKTVYKK